MSNYEIFHVATLKLKPGQAQAAVNWWPAQYAYRILTDASGPFFIVVTETEVESLAAWEQRITEVFSLPEFGDWFGRMTPLVESGRREFYNIEA
jgi:hypothetical protein